MTIARILELLSSHPDSERPSSEPEQGRVTGFQGLRITPFGRVIVEWHWGTRTFANLGELQGWLCGVTPPSWRE